MEELVKYLKALTFLQVNAMSEKQAFQKPEVLLVRAGFSYKEVGAILGKSENAIKSVMFKERKIKGKK